MCNLLLSLMFFLPWLLARFPFTIQYLFLRLFSLRYIQLHFSKSNVICHCSVRDYTLCFEIPPDHRGHQLWLSQKHESEMKSAIMSPSPQPCQRSAAGAGSGLGDSPCAPGVSMGVSRGSSLWILLLRADKLLFHVHEPPEEENPTRWWNDSTIVTGRPCTVSKDTACRASKNCSGDSSASRLLPWVQSPWSVRLQPSTAWIQKGLKCRIWVWYDT